MFLLSFQDSHAVLSLQVAQASEQWWYVTGLFHYFFLVFANKKQQGEIKGSVKDLPAS